MASERQRCAGDQLKNSVFLMVEPDEAAKMGTPLAVSNFRRIADIVDPLRVLQRRIRRDPNYLEGAL